MRHIDDAHHAEGDGEADRGEQQHRGRRHAEDQVLDDAEPDQARFDRSLGAERGGLDRRIVSLRANLIDEALRVLIAARLQRGDRFNPVGARRLRVENDDRRLGLLQRLGGGGIGLARQLRLEDRQRVCVMGLEHLLGGGGAFGGIGTGERQRAHRRFDRPP